MFAREPSVGPICVGAQGKTLVSSLVKSNSYNISCRSGEIWHGACTKAARDPHHHRRLRAPPRSHPRHRRRVRPARVPADDPAPGLRGADRLGRQRGARDPPHHPDRPRHPRPQHAGAPGRGADARHPARVPVDRGHRHHGLRQRGQRRRRAPLRDLRLHPEALRRREGALGRVARAREPPGPPPARGVPRAARPARRARRGRRPDPRADRAEPAAPVPGRRDSSPGSRRRGPARRANAFAERRSSRSWPRPSSASRTSCAATHSEPPSTPGSCATASVSRRATRSRCAWPASCTTSARSGCLRSSSRGRAPSIRRSAGWSSDTRWSASASSTRSASPSEVTMAIRHHHEWWDGRGYPDALFGNQIPVAARIVAIADAYDAMTSDRPYRKALPQAVAQDELEDASPASSSTPSWSRNSSAFVESSRRRPPAPRRERRPWRPRGGAGARSSAFDKGGPWRRMSKEQCTLAAPEREPPYASTLGARSASPSCGTSSTRRSRACHAPAGASGLHAGRLGSGLCLRVEAPEHVALSLRVAVGASTAGRRASIARVAWTAPTVDGAHWAGL